MHLRLRRHVWPFVEGHVPLFIVVTVHNALSFAIRAFSVPGCLGVGCLSVEIHLNGLQDGVAHDEVYMLDRKFLVLGQGLVDVRIVNVGRVLVCLLLKEVEWNHLPPVVVDCLVGEEPVVLVVITIEQNI